MGRSLFYCPFCPFHKKKYRPKHWVKRHMKSCYYRHPKAPLDIEPCRQGERPVRWYFLSQDEVRKSLLEQYWSSYFEEIYCNQTQEEIRGCDPNRFRSCVFSGVEESYAPLLEATSSQEMVEYQNENLHSFPESLKAAMEKSNDTEKFSLFIQFLQTLSNLPRNSTPTIVSLLKSLFESKPQQDKVSWKKILDSRNNEKTLLNIFNIQYPLASIVTDEEGCNRNRLHHVSVSSVLEVYFSYPDIWQYVDPKKPKKISCCITDVADGELYRNHPVFSQHDNAIVFQLVYDGAALNNSSDSGFGFIFLWVGNVPIPIRSHIDHLLFLAAIPKRLINTIGLVNCISPILQDIERFEYGVELDIGGKKTVFYGGLLNSIGDHEGQNAISGRVTNFSTSVRCCRSCLLPRDEWIRSDVDSFPKMTQEDHTTLFKSRHTTSTEKMRKYGFKCKSPLANVTGFDIFRSQPTCFMHNELHGVLEWTLCKCLDEIEDVFNLKRKWIQKRNEHLRQNDPRLRSLLPSCVPQRSQTKKVTSSSGLSAIDTTNLSILLFKLIEPEMSSSLVENPYIRFLRERISVLETVRCSYFTEFMIQNLKEELSHQHEQAVLLFDSIKPKNHMSLHTSEDIANNGPPSTTWMPTGERKIKSEKKLMSHSNHINDSYTICRLEKQQLVVKRIQNERSAPPIACVKNSCIFESVLTPPQFFGSKVLWATKIHLFSLTLKEGDLLVTEHKGVPFKVKSIYLIEDDGKFYCELEVAMVLSSESKWTPYKYVDETSNSTNFVPISSVCGVCFTTLGKFENTKEVDCTFKNEYIQLLSNYLEKDYE